MLLLSSRSSEVASLSIQPLNCDIKDQRDPSWQVLREEISQGRSTANARALWWTWVRRALGTEERPLCPKRNCPCREELKSGFLKMAGPPAMLSYQGSISPGLRLGWLRNVSSCENVWNALSLWPGPACPPLWDSSFIMYFQSSTAPKEAIWQNVQRTWKMFMPFDSVIPHPGL